MPFTITRPGIFMHVLDDHLGTWLHSEESWTYFELASNPEIPMPWIDVDDLAEATARILEAGPSHGQATYDVVAAEQIPLNEIAKFISSLSSRRLEFDLVPHSTAALAKIKLKELEAEQFLAERGDVEEDYYASRNGGNWAADPEPLASDFNLRPTNLLDYVRKRCALL